MIRIPGKLLDRAAAIKILRQQLSQLISRKEALEKQTDVTQKAQEQKQQDLRGMQTMQEPLTTALKRLEQEHGKKLPDQVIMVKVNKGRGKKR